MDLDITGSILMDQIDWVDQPKTFKLSTKTDLNISLELYAR